MATRKRSNRKVVNVKTRSSKNTAVVRKKRRIKFKAVFAFLLVLTLIIIIIMGILSRPITNIYISGNKYLSDQEVIEIAKLSDYPSTLKNMALVIEKRLEKNNFVYKARVSKKKFTQVYIEIEENIPLFYNSSNNQTVMLNGIVLNENIECATLVNYVPDTIYSKFIEKMKIINYEILTRISEIKYDPNDVDSERFLFMMNDGNYVYLTLEKFDSVNNYISIIKNFESKKGILYLDSGEYFKILEN